MLAATEHVRGNRVHRLFVVVGFEQAPVALHRHLKAAAAGEGLHSFGAQTHRDPA